MKHVYIPLCNSIVVNICAYYSCCYGIIDMSRALGMIFLKERDF